MAFHSPLKPVTTTISFAAATGRALNLRVAPFHFCVPIYIGVGSVAWGRVVSITPFLSGQEFQPEVIRIMADVLQRVQERLGLADRSDQFTEIVAAKIVEFAQRGILDPEALFQRTMQEFTSTKP
jgi:hypothetical protein